MLEYSTGFGSVNSQCYWLGNDNIKAITDQRVYTLKVKPSTFSLPSKYKSFSLGTEAEGYKMQYSSYEKTTFLLFSSKDGFGDCSANQQLLGMEFYAHDRDNAAGCATARKAGWWYNSACAFGDLTQDGGVMWPSESIFGKFELTWFSDSSMSLNRE